MPKDYIHRIKGSSSSYRTSNVSRKNQPSMIVGLGFFLVIVLLSASVFGLYELRHHHKSIMHLEPLTNKAIITLAPMTKPIDIHETNAQNTQPVRFDFYQMLPKQSVGLTDLSAPITTKMNSTQQYLLQIATLSTEEDALDMKNDLQKRGFQPNVMKIQRGDHALYRIQIGPFNDETSANKTYQQLKLQNIDSIFLTIQGN